MNVNFHMRVVDGERWCCLSSMGIKRVDIVAYNVDVKEQHSFAGGHRHRYMVARNDVHILVPPTVPVTTLDIEGVKPAPAPKSRHNKKR